MTAQSLPRTWTTRGAPARNGLSDARSTGAPLATPSRNSRLNDRRSTR